MIECAGSKMEGKIGEVLAPISKCSERRNFGSGSRGTIVTSLRSSFYQHANNTLGFCTNTSAIARSRSLGPRSLSLSFPDSFRAVPLARIIVERECG